MCPNCRAFITVADKVCPYCQVTLGPRMADVRRAGDVVAGLVPQARFVTSIILVINVGLYLAMTLYSQRAAGNGSLFDLDPVTLFKFGAKYGPALSAGQWWRYITAGFLHGGVFHIMMNCWALYDLGSTVEEIYGTARMIAFYVVTTIAGFFASNLYSPGLSVGASAGIFGLIGVMIALGVQHRSSLGEHIKGMYMRWALYGLLFGLIPIFRVDNAAHVGGLAAGFAIAWVSGLPGYRRNVVEEVWRGAALVSILLTGYAFVQMYFAFTKV